MALLFCFSLFRSYASGTLLSTTVSPNKRRALFLGGRGGYLQVFCQTGPPHKWVGAETRAWCVKFTFVHDINELVLHKK